MRLVLVFKLVLYAGVAAVSYRALFQIGSPVWFVLDFALYGFSALLLAFNFAHDFSHGTVFERKAWDDLGFTFIFALNGAHAQAWKERHIGSHHFAPNVEHYDTDLEISNLIRVVPGSAHAWYHRFQHLYAPVAYMGYSLFWIFVKDFAVLLSDGRRRRGLEHYVSFVLQKTGYLAYILLLPLLFASQPWYMVLLGFVVMHLLQSLFLLFTFFMTHHVEGLVYPTTTPDGYINTSWVMNQVRSSNDMYPYSRLANFIFGGFNNHIAHHLFPHIHHIYYPELSRLLYRLLREQGIEPHQTTYWGGVCSHLRLLKRMGRSSCELRDKR